MNTWYLHVYPLCILYIHAQCCFYKLSIFHQVCCCCRRYCSFKICVYSPFPPGNLFHLLGREIFLNDYSMMDILKVVLNNLKIQNNVNNFWLKKKLSTRTALCLLTHNMIRAFTMPSRFVNILSVHFSSFYYIERQCPLNTDNNNNNKPSHYLLHHAYITSTLVNLGIPSYL